MFEVKVNHHCKAWRNGDLEDQIELVEVKNFKTRAEAKEYIISKLRGKNNTSERWHKGKESSYAYWFTGVVWQHENSGETMEEYYQYVMKQVKLK